MKGLRQRKKLLEEDKDRSIELLRELDRIMGRYSEQQRYCPDAQCRLLCVVACSRTRALLDDKQHKMRKCPYLINWLNSPMSGVQH